MSTHVQAAVGAALQTLRLELVQSDPPAPPGGPQDYKVTDEAISHLESLKGQVLVVDGEGSVTVK